MAKWEGLTQFGEAPTMARTRVSRRMRRSTASS
jgi:hypothetical protein